MSRIIAVANQKGGVGKTTTAINLSACLAEKNKKVLTLDMDPQGNTTSGLGVDKNQAENTVYELILDESELSECIYPIVMENLSVIPSNINFSCAEIKERLNPKLEIEGVVFTMYDARTNLSLQVVENVKENLDKNIYKTIIPRNVRLAEAPSYGMPINMYDSRSAGAEAYRYLAEEVIEKEDENEWL